MGVTIIGLNVTIANLKRINKQLSNLKKPMQKATGIVTASAKQNVPVDTGHLQKRIMSMVSSSGNTTKGVVGSNVHYAPFMELGTRPHFPPVSALEGWASRHGMNAFVVARTIARRGLKARLYMKRALDENVRRVVRIIVAGIKDIIDET